MSCGIALVVSLLLSDPNVALAAAQPPAPASVHASAPVSVAAEPLFADIVTRSGVVQGWIDSGVMNQADFAASPAFTGFKAQAADLAARDMQGHLILKERGTDGDLKCILRGISEDIPKKIEAVETAASGPARAVALSELAYLLNDNVEVITAPPQPEV